MILFTINLLLLGASWFATAIYGPDADVVWAAFTIQSASTVLWIMDICNIFLEYPWGFMIERVGAGLNLVLAAVSGALMLGEWARRIDANVWAEATSDRISFLLCLINMIFCGIIIYQIPRPVS